MNKQNRSEEYWLYNFNNAGSYTVEAAVLGSEILFTVDPENIRAILATQFSEYGKGETFGELTKGFLGNGVFATDGETWHTGRQLVRTQFTRDRVSDLHCFETHVQNLITVIENGGPPDAATALTAGPGKTVDISDAFFKLAFDVTTEFLLGESVDCWR
jgi:cytochrome P450